MTWKPWKWLAVKDLKKNTIPIDGLYVLYCTETRWLDLGVDVDVVFGCHKSGDRLRKPTHYLPIPSPVWGFPLVRTEKGELSTDFGCLDEWFSVENTPLPPLGALCLLYSVDNQRMDWGGLYEIMYGVDRHTGDEWFPTHFLRLPPLPTNSTIQQEI